MYIVPNTQLDFGDELSHHGILGMKWGIRRYQPYPKGYKGRTEAEKILGVQPVSPKKRKLEDLLNESKRYENRLMDRIDDILDENPNMTIKDIVYDSRFRDAFIKWDSSINTYANEYARRNKR